jgi:hypothetical protein
MPLRPASPSRRAVRAGLTLAEMLVAVTLTAALFAVGLPFFHAQARGIERQAGRLEAQLNARFALSLIDRELRSAGVGVVDDQPLVVAAHRLSVTFNGDIVGLDSAFDGAVNYDPDAPPAAVGGMRRTSRITLPLVGRQYPDCTYVQNGTTTSAETISFWLSPDSSRGRSDEYALFRRANATPPEVVARGLVVGANDRVFRYFRTDSTGAVVEIDSLPAVHTAPLHGTVADTGRSALTDSIRVVRVRLVGRSYDRRTGRETLDTVQTSVRLANAGLLRRKTCGEAPLRPGSIAAVRVWVNGVPEARVGWTATTDEAAGERDVERYVIFRRLLAEIGFGEPLSSVAAGAGSYLYVDNTVEPGETYVYAIAAQDCTPQNSPMREASSVTIEPAAP